MPDRCPRLLTSASTKVLGQVGRLGGTPKGSEAHVPLARERGFRPLRASADKKSRTELLRQMKVLGSSTYTESMWHGVDWLLGNGAAERDGARE